MTDGRRKIDHWANIHIAPDAKWYMSGLFVDAFSNLGTYRSNSNQVFIANKVMLLTSD
jgi:hypothetical protein